MKDNNLSNQRHFDRKKDRCRGTFQLVSLKNTNSYYIGMEIPHYKMKLQSRVLILYLFIALLVLVLIGGVLPASLHKQNLEAISGDSISQLRHIDFALSNFIEEAKYDVQGLSLNDNVQVRDDSHFTSFLNASEETFHGLGAPRISWILGGARR